MSIADIQKLVDLINTSKTEIKGLRYQRVRLFGFFCYHASQIL
jgi:hypothetical protein